DTLPLTPNGKIDRNALPTPNPTTTTTYTAPETATQEKIAALWCEVLDLDRVGIEDNFFALGGHSLLATQVHSRLRAAFDVDLPLSRLFELPTIAALATEVEARTDAARPAPTAIKRIQRTAYRRRASELPDQ
ncbi:hypothetical protein EH183_43535, partial [Streptomyces sp. CB01881]|uniref:phosphopantetheine-binding protein n=1 Tax=Streptomyces sp. CB01881 TaxID=2078691 RepID=UPI0011DF4124